MSHCITANKWTGFGIRRTALEIGPAKILYQINADDCAIGLHLLGQNLPHPCLLVNGELRPFANGEKPCYGHEEWLNTQRSIEDFASEGNPSFE